MGNRRIQSDLCGENGNMKTTDTLTGWRKTHWRIFGKMIKEIVTEMGYANDLIMEHEQKTVINVFANNRLQIRKSIHEIRMEQHVINTLPPLNDPNNQHPEIEINL